MKRRPKIEARPPFTVEDAQAFTHRDNAECPCEPKAVTVNPSGSGIEVLMHRPATQRGRTKRSGTGLPPGWIIQGRARYAVMTEGERNAELKEFGRARARRQASRITMTPAERKAEMRGMK